MTILNRRNGQKFETTQEEFQRLVINAGNAYLYEIVSDDVPIEVKSLRAMKLTKAKSNGTITEVKMDDKKTKQK